MLKVSAGNGVEVTIRLLDCPQFVRRETYERSCAAAWDVLQAVDGKRLCAWRHAYERMIEKGRDDLLGITKWASLLGKAEEAALRELGVSQWQAGVQPPYLDVDLRG